MNVCGILVNHAREKFANHIDAGIHFFKELFIQFNVSSRAFNSMRISAIGRIESNVTYFERSLERKRMQRELKLAVDLTFVFFLLSSFLLSAFSLLFAWTKKKHSHLFKNRLLFRVKCLIIGDDINPVNVFVHVLCVVYANRDGCWWWCLQKIENAATVRSAYGFWTPWNISTCVSNGCRFDNGETRFFLVQIRDSVRCSDELEITFNGLFSDKLQFPHHVDDGIVVASNRYPKVALNIDR